MRRNSPSPYHLHKSVEVGLVGYPKLTLPLILRPRRQQQKPIMAIMEEVEEEEEGKEEKEVVVDLMVEDGEKEGEQEVEIEHRV